MSSWRALPLPLTLNLRSDLLTQVPHCQCPPKENDGLLQAETGFSHLKTGTYKVLKEHWETAGNKCLWQNFLAPRGRCLQSHVDSVFSWLSTSWLNFLFPAPCFLLGTSDGFDCSELALDNRHLCSPYSPIVSACCRRLQPKLSLSDATQEADDTNRSPSFSLIWFLTFTSSLTPIFLTSTGKVKGLLNN